MNLMRSAHFVMQLRRPGRRIAQHAMFGRAKDGMQAPALTRHGFRNSVAAHCLVVAWLPR